MTAYSPTRLIFGAAFARDNSLAFPCRSVVRTHLGLVRAINEDRVFDCTERGLYAVADGMGGHAGGDLAAQATVEALRALSEDDRPVTAAALVAALEVGNRNIHRRNRAHGLNAGSTVVAAYIAPDDMLATIAWAGDSRAYLVRDRTARLLTRDHSVVQDLIDAGLLDARAAADHPRANVITRALGVEERVDIATTTLRLEPGDRLLLCSDGLSRSFADGERFDAPTPDALADGLIANALARDGSDNMSLVLTEIG